MPENFLEINRYFALTSYYNTIGQSNNAFSILGFLWRENKRPCFDLFIHWLMKQRTNTYRNLFSRSYENRSNSCLANLLEFVFSSQSSAPRLSFEEFKLLLSVVVSKSVRDEDPQVISLLANRASWYLNLFR